jgi:hypothetical protein
VAAEERSAPPIWWYAVVALAIVLAVLWIVKAVVGLLLGIVKLAILVVLAVAVIGYVVGRKADR